MPPVKGNGYVSEITEWWGGEGYPVTIHEGRSSEYHHAGEPTEDELLSQATKLTVRVEYDDGNVVHYTRHSPIGWTEDELESNLIDSGDYYEDVVSGGGGAPPPEPPPPPREPPRRPPPPPKREKLWDRIRNGWRRFWRQ